MSAHFALITHFTQRLRFIPLFDKFMPNLGIAFDLMQVRFNDLGRLAFFTPYYKYVFSRSWITCRNDVVGRTWRDFQTGNHQTNMTSTTSEVARPYINPEEQWPDFMEHAARVMASIPRCADSSD
ncbi:unnamed protein product [Protopolystoma xenopodis]|uniref:Uncharacterized protein n=1 Tax=Protopolystoma xenopodis TaxID=117903 RepID=A0A448WM77_9PLAT|nr:unnamed protein product [Protopolystoma xenopodis]